MKFLREANVSGKKVFLRVDFNVPIVGSKITDDNRIQASLPTIKYLLENDASITIGSHLGKPNGEINPAYSLWPIANRLAELLKINVEFDAPASEYKLSDQLILLENLRFDPREEANDEDYAKNLAGGNDLYVNDAFAVSHRANASVAAITKFLPSFAGFLLEKEIGNLSKVKNPEQPFVLIIGGAKVEDKAKMLDKLAPMAEKVLIGGEVANTFLKAKGVDIGKSLYSENMISLCKESLEKYENKIVLPIDYITDEAEGSFKIIDIGEKTIASFVDEIREAKTIFWNGNLGYSEGLRSKEGTKAIAKAMNEASATTIIAGGNTVGVVKEFGFDKNITFISTGGGAALEFLAGEKLPGITALE